MANVWHERRSDPQHPDGRRPRFGGATGTLCGWAAAVVALGVAELVAAARRAWRSPVLDVGDRVVDQVPPAVKDLAIRWFGTNDKLALLVGIGSLLAVIAGGLGASAFRRGRVGPAVVGIAAFGGVGAVAALGGRGPGSWLDAVPSLVGAAAGIGAMVTLWRVVGGRWWGRPRGSERAATGGDGLDRRAAIVRTTRLAAAFALAGAGAGAIGRAAAARFDVALERARIRLPLPRRPAPPIPPSVEVDVAGVSPFITPNRDFYRIDTALTVPQVPLDGYELAVTGLVDRPLRLTFDDLLARDLVEVDITLTCVSNTVGGELVGNARWLGVRLDELLADVGVRRTADQVVGRSVDGYTCGFPLEAATDGRNAIVAVGMNGEPLPPEHGFPARLVVPGLYGYVSATKWLVEIELTTFAAFDHYWSRRGYAREAPIKLMCRIDSVDGLGRLERGADGTVAIGGVAWAQTRGIRSVEVQVDDGPWQAADLGTALNDDTWRQWAYRWRPAHAGRTSLRCRAVDGNGVIQTGERSEPLPDGASGHHQIVVFVS